MKPDRNAAIAVIQSGEATMRPALFVFTTPDGFAWVEPCYLEPTPSRNAFHRVRARLTLSAGGFTAEGEDGRAYIVAPLDSLEDGAGADLREVCAWAERELEAQGRTLDEERDRVRLLLGDKLA